MIRKRSRKNNESLSLHSKKGTVVKSKQRTGNYLYSQSVQTPSPGVKAPGREADNLSPSSAEVNNK